MRTLAAPLLAVLFMSAAGLAADQPQAAAAPAEPVKEFIYKNTPQGELKIFVHLPPDWKASDKRPAIVFFFGGGWTSGTPNQFLPQATYLASRGYLTGEPTIKPPAGATKTLKREQ